MLTRRSPITWVLFMAPALFWPQEAHAQGDYELSRRGVVGLNAQLGIPRGEFDRYVDESFGLGGFLVYNLDRAGRFGLRLDASWLVYGSETVTRPLSLTIPRVSVDVTTENQILSSYIGPQLSLRSGSVTPYLNVGVGLSYFFTESSVSDVDDHFEEIVSSTNFDDLTTSWMTGGGLLVGVSRAVHITLSAQYLRNGRTRYLREGSIREYTDGTVWFDPIESATDLLVLQLGVSFALRSLERDGE